MFALIYFTSVCFIWILFQCCRFMGWIAARTSLHVDFLGCDAARTSLYVDFLGCVAARTSLHVDFLGGIAARTSLNYPSWYSYCPAISLICQINPKLQLHLWNKNWNISWKNLKSWINVRIIINYICINLIILILCIYLIVSRKEYGAFGLFMCRFFRNNCIISCFIFIFKMIEKYILENFYRKHILYLAVYQINKNYFRKLSNFICKTVRFYCKY